MLPYSVLSLQDINEICGQYAIQKVKSFSVLSGGSENSNHLIVTSNGRYVLTICEQKTERSARELAYLLEHLSENRFETSKLIRTKNDAPITVWKRKPVMLKIFLEGEIISDLPSNTLEKIGIDMGRLHQIEAPIYLPRVLSYGIEFFHEVNDYAAGSTFAIWLKEIQDYLQPFFSENLPKSLIHSDIFYSNIVVSGDGSDARIMDFEEAAYYYRIFDIGMSLVGLCCDKEILNLSKVNALLKGYQQEIDLHELEKSSLQAFMVYAAASMTFWRHRNFNHINPNPDMYDHYLGLKYIADYVRNISTGNFSATLN